MKRTTRHLVIVALALPLAALPLAAGDMGVADAKSAEIAESVMAAHGRPRRLGGHPVSDLELLWQPPPPVGQAHRRHPGRGHRPGQRRALSDPDEPQHQAGPRLVGRRGGDRAGGAGGASRPRRGRLDQRLLLGVHAVQAARSGGHAEARRRGRDGRRPRRRGARADVRRGRAHAGEQVPGLRRRRQRPCRAVGLLRARPPTPSRASRSPGTTGGRTAASCCRPTAASAATRGSRSSTRCRPGRSPARSPWTGTPSRRTSRPPSDSTNALDASRCG